MKIYAELIGNYEMQGIKSPCDNKYSTGEYASGGDGRKGGWRYQDSKGDWHFTRGKSPNRTLGRAFENNKGKIIARAKQIFKERMN